MIPYDDFLKSKVRLASQQGIQVKAADVSRYLKPHQAAMVRWAVQGGRRALFAAFGLGKTFGGLMTVPYRAVLKRRRGYGIELNAEYFAVRIAAEMAREKEDVVS